MVKGLDYTPSAAPNRISLDMMKGIESFVEMKSKACPYCLHEIQDLLRKRTPPCSSISLLNCVESTDRLSEK
jgi:hypothetical protein